MKYKILVNNSNGTKSERRVVELASDKKAQKYIDDLNKETGFVHEFEPLDAPKEAEEEFVNEELIVPEKEDEPEDVENENVDIEDGKIIWEDEMNQDEFPRGWHLRKEFVAKDGTVFRRGDEQPDEYRTIAPDDY